VRTSRLLARSGAATLFAWAVAAAFAPFASAATGTGFQRDKTPLPAQLRDTGKAGAAHVAGAGSTLARTIVGLAIVLAVVFGIYWLLKAYAKSKTSTGKGDGRMEIVATTPLAANRSLHLIRVGEDLILVGSSEGGVSRIREYSPAESSALQSRLEAERDPLWPVATGVGPQREKAGFLAELRRRTARR
jgi:flagellar protein FliO/FliZ